ncbi:MAG TPA: protoporphyrinogen oxidase [Rhodothermales bacterium]
MPEKRRIAVIGAGIAGLTTAWELQSAGHEVAIFEASDRPGGVIRSERRNGYLVEYAPNSIQPNETVRGLIDAVGLTTAVTVANPLQKNRFVVRGGRLRPIPLSPGGLLRSDLFTWHGKARLLAEPFVRKARENESVASFVRRRVGQEFLDYALNPFVAGVYAGDPERLSMRHAFPRMVALEQNHGSLVRGMIASRRAARKRGAGAPSRELISFRDGIGMLPNRIAERLSPAVRFNSPVDAIARDESGWRLETRTATPDERFEAVVACLPYYRLSALGLPESSRWPEVTYPPLTVVWLGYTRADVAHPLDGFGVLVPEVEREVQILGALFSSTLFPGRAPDGTVLITVFLGGMRHADAAYLEEDKAIAQAASDVAQLLGISAPPRFKEAVHWKKAIPQYGLHHQDVLDALDGAERRHPGLFFAGNYRGGISVVDTITNACATASRVTASLAGR